MDVKTQGLIKTNWISELVISSLLFIGIAVTVFYNYLLFHVLAEIFSIIILSGIFLVAWNTKEYSESSFFLILGISSAFIGFFDLLHTLSYKGMGFFFSGSNLATQLWIASRYIQALS
ncbi:MAG: histidine kinase, partial [Promethearchaeota archaeon]